ncbi:hypothetical protein D8674_032653 [Pyrus ussuriensis x Pyrus communis]|uniref:Uncharacterized protein n=1 Tax=Pyrus ussuriensis x Pyrus communis TaxID=2448454 RepID=A0A5N5HJP1_9ROSA|nr:uncharacterized protein LOC103927523 [Pyrus x bretschneideri]KAB2627858.1 hypothetical protein D8674_032653 [Pyrus ussuriensis x Pyrus communis]
MEEDYSRSRSSYGGGGNNMQVGSYYGHPTRPPRPTSSYELRSYSVSYAQTQMANQNYNYNNREIKLKKGKSISGSSSNWGVLADPELQRKKRVASYKMYSVEGKMKGSFRKSFRWLKDKYTQVLYSWS